MTQDTDRSSNSNSQVENKNTDTSKETSTENFSPTYELLQENKKYREKNRSLEEKLNSVQSQLESLNKGKLEEQGKYKELYEATMQRFDEKSKELEATKATFGTQSVTSQVKLEAQKLGCVDVDLLLSHFKKDIQTSVRHDEKFNVEPKDVADFLTKAKKEKPLLFSKEAPKVNDAVPKTKVGETDLSKYSTDDLLKAAFTKS